MTIVHCRFLYNLRESTNLFYSRVQRKLPKCEPIATVQETFESGIRPHTMSMALIWRRRQWQRRDDKRLTVDDNEKRETTCSAHSSHHALHMTCDSLGVLLHPRCGLHSSHTWKPWRPYWGGRGAMPQWRNGYKFFIALHWYTGDLQPALYWGWWL